MLEDQAEANNAIFIMFVPQRNESEDLIDKVVNLKINNVGNDLIEKFTNLTINVVENNQIGKVANLTINNV